MKRYTLSHVIGVLNQKYTLELNMEQAAKVKKQLLQVGFSSTINAKEVVAVKTAVLSICKKRCNPLKISAAASASLELVCPVCRTSDLQTVQLADARKAKYCPEHFVVIPLPVDNN